MKLFTQQIVHWQLVMSTTVCLLAVNYAIIQILEQFLQGHSVVYAKQQILSKSKAKLCSSLAEAELASMPFKRVKLRKSDF